MISRLTATAADHFVTATSAPCLSSFKPIHVGQPLDLGAPTGIEDDTSTFWRFERLHRRVIGDHGRCAEHAAARDADEAATWRGGRDPREAFAAFDRLVAASSTRTGGRDDRPWLVRRYWSARARDAHSALPKLPAR